MARLSLRMLGPFEATLDGLPIVGCEAAKIRALLAYLAVQADRPHRREVLAELLWPGRTTTDALRNLRHGLFHLRNCIGDRRADPPFLLIGRETLQFNPASDYWLDVAAFEECLAGDDGTPVAVGQLEAAVDLWRGEFLEGLCLDDSSGFEDWLRGVRERTHRQMVGALRRLARHYERGGDLERARTYAQRRVELAPWDEEAHQQLIRLLAGSGDRSAALAQYARCRELLAEELGVEPGPETVSLVERIRGGTLQPASPSAVSAALLPWYLWRGTVDLSPEKARPVFVGRGEELTRLNRFLDRALAGQGQVAFVVGEPGSGKTMLLGEFVRRAMREHDDVVAATGRCNAYTGIGDPYLPFLEILQMLCGDIEPHYASGAITREHALRLWSLLPTVVGALLGSGRDLVDRFVSGTALLSRTEPFVGAEHPWREHLQDLVHRLGERPATAPTHQTALFEQYTHVLQALARQRPLILVLDDLQWADVGSTSLLFHLARRLAGSRILVVGLYRPGDVLHDRDGHQHPLHPVIRELAGEYGDTTLDLSRSEGWGFVQALLDSEPNSLGQAFRESLYRHTGGHPLFTVELLRGLQERGDLHKDEAGRWIEGPSLDWDTIPPRVEAAIAARIGHLKPEQEALLTVASVEGEEFTAEVVARALGGTENEVSRQLSGDLRTRHRLVVAAGLERSGAQRLSRYRFRHHLFQSYLYRGLDGVRRARLHEEVGTAVEAIRGEATPSVVAELARHFEEAGRADKAVGYLLEAGRQAIDLSADREAVAYLRRGLALLEVLPDTPERDKDELRMLVAIHGSLWRTKGSGADPDVARASLRAWELWEEVGEPEQLVPVLWGLSAYHTYRAELEMARDVGQRVLGVGRSTGDGAVMLQGHYMLGTTFWFLGRPAEAREHFERAVALYDPVQHRGLALESLSTDLGVGSLMHLGGALNHLGYLDQARESYVEALALARQLDNPFVLAHALGSAARPFLGLGEQELARGLNEESLALSTEYGFPETLSFALRNRAEQLYQCGRYDEALAQFHQVVAMAVSQSDEVHVPVQLAFLAEIHGRMGQTEEAMRLVEQAVETLSKSGQAESDPYPHLVKGELLAQRGYQSSLREAEGCFQKAMEIARRTQQKREELLVAMGWARLWQVQGKTEDAHDMLAEIYGWFTEGFDTRYLREARELLQELSRPPRATDESAR